VYPDTSRVATAAFSALLQSFVNLVGVHLVDVHLVSMHLADVHLVGGAP